MNRIRARFAFTALVRLAIGGRLPETHRLRRGRRPARALRRTGSGAAPSTVPSAPSWRRTGGAPPSKPAAITVMRSSSPKESSMTVPKMMLASACAASRTNLAAVSTSLIPRLDPPAMLSSTPCAPSIDASSSGDAMAPSAAASARFSPRALDTPMSAVPAPFMTDFTSLKSTLMRPGVVMRSVMPCTPP